MASVANINDVLTGHVALEIECVDRLYLNAYVPSLQVGGQVVRFLAGHLRQSDPVAGAGSGDRKSVSSRGQGSSPPSTRSRSLRSKSPIVRVGTIASSITSAPICERAEDRAAASGWCAIVACQEFQWVISARNRSNPARSVCLEFFREERRVGVYYFYVLDPDFGPGFIKICTYFPYPAKVWVNGHEWAKRQAEHAGVEYRALSNGFAACAQPEVCRRSATASAPRRCRPSLTAGSPSCRRRSPRRPRGWLLVGALDAPGRGRRTLVFDDPRRARSFFEALVADNIAIGRPEQIAIVFARQLRKTTRARSAPACSPPAPMSSSTSPTSTAASSSTSKTAAHCGSRPSSTSPTISTSPRASSTCPRSSPGHAQINQRLLMIERAGQSCAIGSALFERIHQPYNHEGQRTGALRFGDSRAMALAGALCTSCCTPSPASPTRAFAGTSPDSSANPTAPAR